MRAHPARSLVAVLAVAGLLLGRPATAAAHAQLVSSDPAAGDVVATAPTTLHLAFSEPIAAAGTNVDVLDANGRILASHVGAPDPADPYTLVVPLPALSDGIVTVDWRSLSAADGHATSGTLTFGIGDVAPPPLGAAVAVHDHDAATTFLETEARILGDLGLLLAFGLPVVAAVVLRRSGDPVVARATAAGLALGGVTAVALLGLGAGAANVALGAFAATQDGTFLLARAAAAGLGALVVILGRGRTRAVSLLGAAAAGIALALLAASGHAGAFGSPAPVVAVAVHVGAVGIWLSGIALLAWTATLGRGYPPTGELVPRFSALALVSVALIVLTGAYTDWLVVRGLPDLSTTYAATLLVKVLLALVAFALGGWNYLRTTREAGGTFPRRVTLEALLAIGIVVATGVLTSDSPPGPSEPIAIAATRTSGIPITPTPVLALAPGRAGPTRFVVTLGAPLASSATVELDLQRTDQPGDTRVPLRLQPGTTATFAAGAGLLPAGGSWAATVIERGADGVESGRATYAFAMGAADLAFGEATSLIDPVLLIVLALGVLAGIGGLFLVARRVPPRVDRRVGRGALGGGVAVAIGLAAVLLLGGPRL